jgi:serine-protein kinase ATM
VAEARLEKPEAIIRGYMAPAVKELKGNSEGNEAGRVFHKFAIFCDQQLQNPDGLEDFRRVEQLRHRKEEEVLALDTMIQTADGEEKTSVTVSRTKAKQWLDLDDEEYKRLKRGREAFLEQCLENYLLCLKACETYNNDALRFCALWLDKSDDDKANHAVGKHIAQVPSRKFALLMNQLSSRLLDNNSAFQSVLFSLTHRICVEHPYHGLYQIFANIKSKHQVDGDQTAVSRCQAAEKIVERLQSDELIGKIWNQTHNVNVSYIEFATHKLGNIKSSAKIPLKTLLSGKHLEQGAKKLPPPTMKIPLRIDCDYSKIPKVHKLHPEFTVAGGLSAPKVVTAYASDGLRYKLLVSNIKLSRIPD